MRNVAVLVGNGLSIAFNPQLNLRVITGAMTTRISDESEDGSDVVAAMKEIAERALPAGVNSDSDFEILVGAFGAESRTMGYLKTLAGLVSPQDESLRDSIQKVSEFAEQVRDTGLSHVLEVIFDNSYGDWDTATSLHGLVRATTSAFAGRVVFGNLNYDTLLLSALLATCQHDLADMGHGWKETTVTERSGSIRKFPALRKSATDWPNDRRVRLLHLHGSLTYWSDRERTIFAKIDAAALRSYNQWAAVRRNDTTLRPVVILANQKDKSAKVTEFPFSLAYELFDAGLRDSSHWLIIGYSFKDDPVNAMLRREFTERTEKPKVLVVTFEDDPTLHDVERAFGWGAEDGPSDDWLRINRGGANGVETTADWNGFVSDTAPREA